MNAERAGAGAPDAANASTRPQWALAAGIGLALVVLAGTILASVLHLRQHLREQIAGRDGEILEAMAAMQYLDDKTNEEAIAALDDPGEQLQVAMEISRFRLRNVIGCRLFSAEGQFVNAFPFYLIESSLPATDLARLQALQPVSHFLPSARLQEHDLFAESSAAPVPLLEVNVPLHEEGQSRLLGVAQFLMNGASIALAYGQLDRHLAAQGALTFGIGGSILTLGLLLAFRRVQKTNRLLSERTANLLKANRELALAAKTSAVGALTSHLIHGLKNPLSGLQSFVQEHAPGHGNGHDTDWELAVASTRRMEGLINRVLRVLQEQQTVADYEVSLAELAEALESRLQPAARAAGVSFLTSVQAKGVLSNREADLILLILENLAQNAIEATPGGKTVRFSISSVAGHVALEVRDEGPGLPPEVAARLFQPCASTKKGGSGIGLAISQLLARHLGAALELEPRLGQGCAFRLTLAGAEERIARETRELALETGS